MNNRKLLFIVPSLYGIAVIASLMFYRPAFIGVLIVGAMLCGLTTTVFAGSRRGRNRDRSARYARRGYR